MFSRWREWGAGTWLLVTGALGLVGFGGFEIWKAYEDKKKSEDLKKNPEPPPPGKLTIAETAPLRPEPGTPGGFIVSSPVKDTDMSDLSDAACAKSLEELPKFKIFVLSESTGGPVYVPGASFYEWYKLALKDAEDTKDPTALINMANKLKKAMDEGYFADASGTVAKLSSGYAKAEACVRKIIKDMTAPEGFHL